MTKILSVVSILKALFFKYGEVLIVSAVVLYSFGLFLSLATDVTFVMYLIVSWIVVGLYALK